MIILVVLEIEKNQINEQINEQLHLLAIYTNTVFFNVLYYPILLFLGGC